MRAMLMLIYCAALTLWLGGLVALFIFVQFMFRTDRAIAVNAAPLLFEVFEKYQLLLLVISMVSLIGWRLVVCSRPKRWITVLMILAGIGAVSQAALVSSRMRVILTGGQSSDAEFRRLHGYSMMIYTSQTVILAAAACLLPATISAEAGWRPRTASRNPPGQTAPDEAARQTRTP